MELTPKLMSISAVVEGLEGVIGKNGVVVLRSALAHGSVVSGQAVELGLMVVEALL